MAGLIYQVIWVRRFGAIFGNTLHSAALVTGVFMCGLGTGSYVVGRLSDRRHGSDPAAPLRFYGYSELVIAACGMVLTLLLPRLAGFSAGLSSYQLDEVGWSTLSTTTHLFHYVVAIVALAPPCFVMGGTLTLLIRFMVGRELAAAGWRVGLLYGVNTAGAALGALLTDFYFVPFHGIHTTELVAITLNVAAGIGALMLATRSERSAGGAFATAMSAETLGPLPKERAGRGSIVVLTGLALGLAGFAAMGVEILWFRYLSQILGQFRSVFSLLLAVMLVGIWLGSFAGGYLHRCLARPALLFVLAQSLLVVVTLALLGLFDHRAAYQGYVMEIRQQFVAASPAGRAWLALWATLRPILVVVGLPSLLMGFAFPLANATVQKAAAKVGARAGALYLANTLGNVLGASLVGFVLLPWMGIRLTTLILCGCAAASVVPLYLAAFPTTAARNRDRTRYAFVGGLLVAGLSLFAFGLLPADRLLLPSIPRGDEGGTRQIISVSEGQSETIVVTEVAGYERKLFTNGHAMSATSPSSQRYMRAFVHLPLLQMDRPERVLVICFGVGNTLHAASLHESIERIEIADLSRHVLDQAPYFEAANHGVLSDPRVSVFINDGRHHLMMQPVDRYDLVTLEPPPIPFAGVAALYSREFYQLVRSRLKPAGTITQWLPAYQVRGETVLSMVRAFVDVFPQSVLLSGDDKELIMMGTRAPSLAMDVAAVAERLAAAPAVQADLERIQMGSMVELAGTFVASSATLEAATRTVSAVTDDRPLLEYSELSGMRATRMPSQLFDLSGIDDWCVACRERVPGLVDYLDVLSAIYASSAYLVSGQMSRAGGSTDSLRLPESAGAQNALARSPYLQRMFGPRSWTAMRVGEALLQQNNASRAVNVLRHGVYLSPGDAEGHALLGRALVATGEVRGAAFEHDQAARLDPNRAEYRFEFAVALRRIGEKRGAVEQCAIGVQLAPNDADGRYLYAGLLQAAGRAAAAEEQLTRALSLHPRHPGANLVLCKRAVIGGRFGDALRCCDIAAAGGLPIPPDLAARLAPHRAER
ncbi:MAG: hypothetical protein DRI90_21495 [Deltaproteobacteria bacterium]|nr:MAG: hypothetical protein DRI90_21495 [Deltaproteobacteria bacterium]